VLFHQLRLSVAEVGVEKEYTTEAESVLIAVVGKALAAPSAAQMAVVYPVAADPYLNSTLSVPLSKYLFCSI